MQRGLTTKNAEKLQRNEPITDIKEIAGTLDKAVHATKYRTQAELQLHRALYTCVSA